MNVRQLIDALSALDPEIPVAMPSFNREGYCEVAAVFAGLVLMVSDGAVKLADEREPGRQRAALLFEPDD